MGVILGTVLATSMSYGQGTTSGPGHATPAATAHGAFPVKVIKTLDSSKLKEGDSVEVETSAGFKLPDGMLVPKGSQLTGHVVTAKARSKGDTQSRLTLAFDKLSLANGKQFVIQGTVQAAFPPPDEVDPGVPGASTSPNSGLGGGLPAPDYRPSGDIKTGSNTSSTQVEKGMDPKATGVRGIHDLSLEDGIFISKGKNVKLNGGDRMIIHVDIF